MDAIIITIAFIVGVLIGRNTAPVYRGSDALRRYIVRDIGRRRRELRKLIRDQVVTKL